MSDFGLLPTIQVECGQSVLRYDRAIGGHVLLCYYLDHGEIVFQSRTLDLAGLFDNCALGHQHDVMALGQVLKRLGNAMQNLDRVFGDGVSESANRFMQRGRERLDCQPLESLHQRVAENCAARSRG